MSPSSDFLREGSRGIPAAGWVWGEEQERMLLRGDIPEAHFTRFDGGCNLEGRAAFLPPVGTGRVTLPYQKPQRHLWSSGSSPLPCAECLGCPYDTTCLCTRLVLDVFELGDLGDRLDRLTLSRGLTRTSPRIASQAGMIVLFPIRVGHSGELDNYLVEDQLVNVNARVNCHLPHSRGELRGVTARLGRRSGDAREVRGYNGDARCFHATMLWRGCGGPGPGTSISNTSRAMRFLLG